MRYIDADALRAMRGAANSYKMHYEAAKADTVRKMQERLHVAFRSDDGSIRNPDCYIRYVLDQTAKELLEEAQ